MANLIALDKWCEDTGIPRTTFRGWQRKLERGKHYFVAGRTTIVDPGEIEAWLKDSDGNLEPGKRVSLSTNKPTRHRSSSPIVTLV